jgi:hypothetical protein
VLESLNHLDGSFEAIGVLHRAIHLPMSFDKFRQWAIVIWPLLGGATPGGHDRITESPIARPPNESDQGFFRVVQLVSYGRYTLRINTEELTECGSIRQHPGIHLSNRNSEEKIRVLRERQPFRNQLRWTGMPVEVGENEKRGASCCLIKPANRLLKVAESAAPVAIPDQVASPRLFQNRAKHYFAEGIFNRKTDRYTRIHADTSAT